MLNGSIRTNNGYQGRYYQIDWTADQSVGNNSSTIHWVLSCAGGAVGQWGPLYYVERTLYVNIAGNVVINKTNEVRRYPGQIADGYVVVNHGANGAASFSIDIKAATYYSNVDQGCKGFGSYELNTIARASQPSCKSFPHNTEYVGDMGMSIYIHMNRASNSFTHNVRYTFGNTSAVIGTNVTDNVLWTIPTDLAYQVKNSTSGYGTITVDTFNGGQHIGTKTCRFTCSVPNSMVPSVSNASISIDNSADKSGMLAKWGVCVSGISKIHVNASAVGSHGSSVKSYYISGGYSTNVSGSELNFTGGTITSSENKTFQVQAVDSRGRRSGTVAAGDVYVHPYNNPYVTSLTATRSNNTVSVYADWNFASIGGKNTSTATLSYKTTSGNNWTDGGTIGKASTVTLDANLDDIYSYDIKVTVTDALGKSSSQTTTIPTKDVLLDFREGGHGLGIGKIAETDSMEIFMNAKFMKDLWITDVSYKGDNINLRNVRNLVDWNKLLNKPNVFPPANHSHSYLPLEGGSLSGSLSVNGISNGHGTPYGWLDFYSGENNMVNMFIATNDGNRFTIRTQNGCDGITFRPNDGESDGNVSVVGSIVYTESCFQFSAKKFKKNITKIMDADKLLSLEPVEFDYKDTGTHSVGLIADDVAKYFPNLIYYENEKVTGLNYVGLIPYMIKKIQMQQEEIDELKAKKNDGGN